MRAVRAAPRGYRPGKPAGCQHPAQGDIGSNELSAAVGLVEPCWQSFPIPSPLPLGQGRGTLPRPPQSPGLWGQACVHPAKTTERGLLLRQNFRRQRGLEGPQLRPRGKQRTNSAGNGTTDSTDQKPRRGREKIREPGTEGFQRLEAVGSWKPSGKRGGGLPRGPGRGGTVWVARAWRTKAAWGRRSERGRRGWGRCRRPPREVSAEPPSGRVRCETAEPARGRARLPDWQTVVSCPHREGSSAFHEGPIVSSTTERKREANASVLIYNGKDGCGQSRMFTSADP